MCAEAGLKPHEYRANYLEDNWIHLSGYQRQQRGEWERTRAISYNVAKFGNSDPKKFRNMTMQRYWPFPWDNEGSAATKDPRDIRRQWEEGQKQMAMLEAKKQAAKKIS